MAIALLGGSFNPIHFGHLFAASWALLNREPDEVWIVPAYRHPFGKALTHFEDRVMMAELAVAPLGPRFRVVRAEQDSAAAGGDGSTVTLLRFLADHHPGQRFLLVLGGDIALEQDRWKSFDEIQRLAEVVFVNRQGYPEIDGAGPPLPAISSVEIRRRLALGEPMTGLVPAAVERHLRAHHLYDAPRSP
jgi:nicotinate-nucleotide adenylyltransferase